MRDQNMVEHVPAKTTTMNRDRFMLVLVLAVVVAAGLAVFRIFFAGTSIVGTWVVDSIEADGVHYAADDLYELSGVDAANFSCSFQEDGTASIVFDGEVIQGTWTETSDNAYLLSVSESVFSTASVSLQLKNGKLEWYAYGGTLYLRKL